MLYAGLRPERIRKLVNLEGFGMPRVDPTRRQALRPVARRPEDDRDAMKPLSERRGGGRAPAEDQPAAAQRPRRMARAPMGETARAGQTAAGALGTARRPGAQARHAGPLPRRRRARDLEADPCAAAVGRGRPHRHRTLVGQPLHEGRIPRAPEDGRDVETHVLSPAGHMLHHDQPEQLARLDAFLDA